MVETPAAFGTAREKPGCPSRTRKKTENTVEKSYTTHDGRQQSGVYPTSAAERIKVQVRRPNRFVGC